MLAKEIHPYVLHNFDNSLDAVSTTAHEFGHAMHSYFSANTQPAIYADYTTFLAEIASTCNEALLNEYLMDEADDIDMKLLLLNQRLESIRLTIFRQTLFADFELRFHEHAEAGNPLTAEYLNTLYGDMIKEYYGPNFALGAHDMCEWMFIPHFYYNFYVFTYATGLTSGLAMADLILEQGQDAADAYINNMLKAGSSAPPLDILRSAGVDLETPAPILSAMKVFEQTVEGIRQAVDPEIRPRLVRIRSWQTRTAPGSSPVPFFVHWPPAYFRRFRAVAARPLAWACTAVPELASTCSRARLAVSRA